MSPTGATGVEITMGKPTDKAEGGELRRLGGVMLE